MATSGSISCLMSLPVFNRKTLRKNPCSIYMSVFHIINFVYTITIMLPSILTIGYEMTMITSALGLCRFSLYMAYVLDVLEPNRLILAASDRLMITSQNVRTRQRSTCRLAYMSIDLIECYSAWTKMFLLAIG